MFINNYVGLETSLDEVQFALALAVDIVSSPENCKIVLSYLARNYITDVHKDTSEVAYEHMLIDDVATARNTLEQELISNSTNKKGLVYEYIKHVYTNKVYWVKVTKRLSVSAKQVSLSDLVAPVSIDELYSQTMSIIMSYPKSSLLIRYMASGLFKQEFTKYLKIVHGKDKFGNINYYDEATVEIIINEARKVLERKLGQEPYALSGNNPTAFIAGFYTNFYLKEYSFRIKRVLNARGLYSPLKEDFTVIDTVETVDNFSVELFNFKEIANRIFQASRLLFLHNGNNVFTDIFTIYKENKVQSKVNKVVDAVRHNKYVKVNFYKSTDEFSGGDDDTIKSKYKGRKEICDDMEIILREGISPDSIFDLYETCYKTTSNLSSRNAARLFNVEGKKNSQGLTNSEKMKILVNGYVALGQLINYLESPSNKTGITVESFPTTIFRDFELCKRFTSIKEYVSNVDLVMPLISEAKQNSKSVGVGPTGILSNDEVLYSVEILDSLEKENKKESMLLRKLKEIGLTKLQKAIDLDANSTISISEKIIQLRHKLRREIDYWFKGSSLEVSEENKRVDEIDINGYRDDERENPLKRKYRAFIDIMEFRSKCFDAITYEDGNPVIKDKSILGLNEKVVYLLGLISFSKSIGIPLLDNNYKFLVKPNTTLFEMYSDPKTTEQYNQLLGVYRTSANKPKLDKIESFYREDRNDPNYTLLLKHFMVDAFTDVCLLFDVYSDEEVDDLATIIMSFDIVLKLANKFESLLTELAEFSNDKKDIYLFLSRMAKEKELLRIPRKLKSIDDVSSLPVYPMINTTETFPYTGESINRVRQRLGRIVGVINNLFEETPSLFEFLDLVNKAIEEQLVTYVEEVNYNPMIEMRLEEAYRDMLGFTAQGTSASDGSSFYRSELQAKYERDQFEFIRIRGKRLNKQGKMYYSSLGYVVTLSPVGDSDYVSSIRVMEKFDIAFIESAGKLTGYVG